MYDTNFSNKETIEVNAKTLASRWKGILKTIYKSAVEL